MTRILPALFLALTLPLPALAQGQPEGSSVARVLAEAGAECQAAADGAPSDLEIAPAAITWTDLDGDGDKDDAVVDFNLIFCPLMASAWAGTGGAPVHVLPDAAEGGPGHVWTGWDWQVVGHGGQPLFLMSRHGTACGGSGADTCVMALSLTPEGPMVLGGPENAAEVQE